MLSLSGFGQYIGSQRQEGKQCHVIGYEHRANKGNVHQGKDADPGVAEDLDQLLGQYVEEMDILQGAHHRQHAEQAGQGLNIEVIQVSFIRRYKEASSSRRDHGNYHHHIFLKKTGDTPV